MLLSFISQQATATTIFTDNFSDGDYNANPVWTIGAGTWNATSNYLGTTSTNAHIHTPSSATYSGFITTWQFDAKVNSNNRPAYIAFAANTSDYNPQGYRFDMRTDESFKLKIITGAETTIIDAGDLPVGSTTYTIKVIRSLAGTWELFIDGILKGTVSDTNHSSSSYFLVMTGSATSPNPDIEIDNISVTQVRSLIPDANISYPTLNGVQLKGGSVITLDFNVIDMDTNAVDMNFDLNYSTSSTQGTGTVIVNDGNVAKTQGLSCDSNNFVTKQQCHYTWTVPSTDTNYFILLSITDNGGETDFDASDNNFIVDSTKPSTAWDGNSTWQATDANIHLTCSDGAGSGCGSTVYRKDSNSDAGINFGNQIAYDTNILFSTDGNYTIDTNSTDGAGNIGDSNIFYVLIDKNSPIVVTQNITSGTSDSAPDFNIQYTDVSSGVKKCYYDQYTNSSLELSNQSVDANADGWCNAVNTTPSLGEDSTRYLIWKGQDNVDNNSSTTQTTTYEFDIVADGGGSGSSGGSGGGVSIGTPDTDFKLIGATDTGKIEFAVTKFVDSRVSLIIENTGLNPINNLVISFKDIDPELIEQPEDFNGYLKPGERKEYNFLFKSKSLSDDANQITSTISISGGARTKTYQATFQLQESGLAPYIKFGSEEFFGLRTNAVLATIAGLLVVLSPRTLKLGKQIEVGLGIATLFFLVMIPFTGGIFV